MRQGRPILLQSEQQEVVDRSVYLQEVQVIATAATGSCEMAVEVSVGDALHGALPLGSAVSGDCRYGQLSAEPNTLALASISPADVVDAVLGAFA